jgi:hypothetical protein
MSAIIQLILGLIPPVIAGPLAGLAFISILKRGRIWHQIAFWVSLVAADLLVMFWVVSSSGAWFPVSSISACFFTPAAPILTIIVMRRAWRRLEVTGGISVTDKRWYRIGSILIPGLQIGMFVALILFGPLLCKVGLVVCQDL